jgi:AcrR family transcriptional regulator
VQKGSDLRERKKMATREALHEAAVKLFAQKGYGNTSVDEIAAAADVSRSTFFRYFGSKEAVVFSMPDDAGERYLELLAARPADEGPLKAVEEALVQLSTEGDTESQRSVAIDREELLESEPDLKARQAELTDAWTARLAQGLADREGVDEPEARHRLVAAICVAMSQEMGEEWLESGIEPERLVRGRFDILRDLIDS